MAADVLHVMRRHLLDGRHLDARFVAECLALKLDQRGNVATGENYMSSVPGVFAAGDMRRGQSLVVWAIREGRQCARAIDESLMGSSLLPR